MRRLKNTLLVILILSMLCSNTVYAVDARRYKVISKGCTLVGRTMYKSKAGSNKVKFLGDSPKYLCCSSFVSWAYSRSGVAHIDYSTWDFCNSSKFRKIPPGDLKPGDIGLIQDRRKTGNHVAIYMGKRGGKRLWLHCSSHAGRNGVTIGTDKRLKVFYRYRGFKD